MTLFSFKKTPLVLLLSTLTGCIFGPSSKAPDIKDLDYLPKSIPGTNTSLHIKGEKKHLDDEGLSTQAQEFEKGRDIGGSWWEVFECKNLNNLIEEALKNNPSLNAMQHNLREAWENRRIEGAALYPSVSGDFDLTRQKTSSFLSPVPNSQPDNPYSITSPGTYINPSNDRHAWHYGLHTAQLEINYIPDLWGGKRNAVKQSAAAAEITQSQVEATALTLIGNIATTAIAEAGLRADIEIVKDLAAKQKAILDLEEKQFKAGEINKSVPTTQRFLWQDTLAILPNLEKQLIQTHTQLAILVGKPPNADMPSFRLDDFKLPMDLPLSYPTSLLEHRPDVRAAHAQIKSAAAQVGIAIANRLPNVQLSATPGQVVGNVANFFSGGMGNWSIGAAFTQPLFQGGELLHAQRAAKQVFLSSRDSYKASVLSAMKDVSDSLVAIEHDRDALEADTQAVKSAREATKIAEISRKAGETGFLQPFAVVLTQIQEERKVKRDIAIRLSDSVGLFQSLGGGWWNRNDLGVSKKKAHYLSTTLLPW